MSASTSDKESIDHLITQFFGIFNNKEASSPDWELIFQICIPEALIIKKVGIDQTVYNLKAFIEPRKEILTNRTLTDFEELELSEQTSILKDIAHRQCRYGKSGYLEGAYFSGQGSKLFQLIRITDGWKISSVVWEDDVE